jgi:hypothetical protein
MKKVCMLLLCVGICGVCLGFTSISKNSLPGNTLDENTILTIKAGDIKGYCTEKNTCTANNPYCGTKTDQPSGNLVCVSNSGCGSCSGLKNKSCDANSESPYTCIDVYFSCCTAPNSCATISPNSQYPNGGCTCSGSSQSNFGTRTSC